VSTWKSHGSKTSPVGRPDERSTERSRPRNGRCVGPGRRSDRRSGVVTTLVVSATAIWAMIGLIWMVQVVHYPMLATYSATATAPATAAADHQRRISRVVGPLMAAEGVSALILLVDRPDTMPAWSAWAAAALLGVALASTVVVQVPLHTRLAERHDDRSTLRHRPPSPKHCFQCLATCVSNVLNSHTPSDTRKSLLSSWGFLRFVSLVRYLPSDSRGTALAGSRCPVGCSAPSGWLNYCDRR
jgi:hypothetical protein